MLLRTFPLLLATALSGVSCSNECEKTYRLSAEPAELTVDRWTTVRVTVDTDYFSPQTEQATAQAIVIIQPAVAGRSLHYVKGSERDADRLRDIRVLDKRTVEFEVSVPPETQGGAVDVQVSNGSGETTFCTSSYARTRIPLAP